MKEQVSRKENWRHTTYIVQHSAECREDAIDNFQDFFSLRLIILRIQSNYIWGSAQEVVHHISLSPSWTRERNIPQSPISNKDGTTFLLFSFFQCFYMTCITLLPSQTNSYYPDSTPLLPPLTTPLGDFNTTLPILYTLSPYIWWDLKRNIYTDCKMGGGGLLQGLWLESRPIWFHSKAFSILSLHSPYFH